MNDQTTTTASRDDYPDSWYAASVALPDATAPLNEALDVDVCVIGAGYTGLSSAIHLARKGKKVALLEAERAGWGASGRNGGHVGTGQRVDQEVLEKQLGMQTAKQLWQLGLDAVQLVSDLISDYEIDCELGSGNLHFAAKRSHSDEIEEEVAHLNAVYGYDQISFIEMKDIEDYTSAQGFYGASYDRGAKHLHPLKYALGLRAAALSEGVHLFEKTPALKYETTGNRVFITTPNGSVSADRVVMACNGYLEKLCPTIAPNIMPINNFIVASEPLSDELADQINRYRTSLSDTLFVINYWKLSDDNRMIFGGGENYSRRFPSDIINFVKPKLLKIHPDLANTRLEYGWGGTLAITLNRMPDIGIVKERVFYAQGFSGHGVPTATMAGKLIADAILGECSDFDLMRGLPTRAFPGGTLLRWPGLVAGMLFYSLRDRLGR